MKIETLAVHTGREVDPVSGAVSPVLVTSTTFERAGDGSFPTGYIYTRGGNPNRRALEEILASLEGGEDAVAFSSGSAATMAILHALAPGDHVIIPDDMYYGTRRIVEDLFVRWGIEASRVDTSSPDAVTASLRPNTRLVWIETPSNPRLKVADISRISRIAHEAGALCACDNTFATPLLQRPLDLGADMVLHSTTKYIGGHSDVLGGAVVVKSGGEYLDRIRAFQTTGGAVPSPFDCWLLLRSIPTLPYRMRAHSENAMRVAEFLAGHPNVTATHYPGLPDHPGHALAARQMKAFGGIVSFEVDGGREGALGVAARLRLIIRATSLGGVESLVEHRASIEGNDTPTPEGLLRMSIGLEHPDDLIADLDQALRGGN